MLKANIILVFILFTIAGTLIHEAGHYLMGRTQNYHCVVHYDRTSCTPANDTGNAKNNRLISIAGVATTVGLGLLAFITGLSIARRSSASAKLFWVMLTFFWSREIVVLVTDVIIKAITGSYKLSDEQRICLSWGLPKNLLSVLLGILGGIICTCSIFYMVPPGQRGKFIVSGALGSIAGYILWFKVLGPVVLP